MGGITISDIRAAKLKAGMTEKQADAEMRGLLIKINEIDTGENGNDSEILQPTKHPISSEFQNDPLIEAQHKLMEQRSETQRRDIPLSYDYWMEMRRKAMGDEPNGEI